MAKIEIQNDDCQDNANAKKETDMGKNDQSNKIDININMNKKADTIEKIVAENTNGNQDIETPMDVDDETDAKITAVVADNEKTDDKNSDEELKTGTDNTNCTDNENIKTHIDIEMNAVESTSIKTDITKEQTSDSAAGEKTPVIAVEDKTSDYVVEKKTTDIAVEKKIPEIAAEENIADISAEEKAPNINNAEGKTKDIIEKEKTADTTMEETAKSDADKKSADSATVECSPVVAECIANGKDVLSKIKEVSAETIDHSKKAEINETSTDVAKDETVEKTDSETADVANKKTDDNVTQINGNGSIKIDETSTDVQEKAEIKTEPNETIDKIIETKKLDEIHSEKQLKTIVNDSNIDGENEKNGGMVVDASTVKLAEKSDSTIETLKVSITNGENTEPCKTSTTDNRIEENPMKGADDDKMEENKDDVELEQSVKENGNIAEKNKVTDNSDNSKDVVQNGDIPMDSTDNSDIKTEDVIKPLCDAEVPALAKVMTAEDSLKIEINSANKESDAKSNLFDDTTKKNEEPISSTKLNDDVNSMQVDESEDVESHTSNKKADDKMETNSTNTTAAAKIETPFENSEKSEKNQSEEISIPVMKCESHKDKEKANSTQTTEMRETIETNTKTNKEKISRVEITIEQTDRQYGQTTQTTTHIVKEISITEQLVCGKTHANQPETNGKATVEPRENGKVDVSAEANGKEKSEVNDSDKENEDEESGTLNGDSKDLVCDVVVKKCQEVLADATEAATTTTES